VQEVLAQPAARTGAAARARALEFDWTCTVAGFLAVHGLTTPSAVAS
jgi:hypothetical protein